MELQIINEQEVLGKEFKVYGTPEEPMFLAKDVKEWIDHNNITLMLNNIDEEEKLTYAIHNSGQKREMWFLTESGLYEVLMQSRKPIAKAFKKEVKLILKSIRQHGAYMTPQALEQALLSPDFLIQLAEKLKEEQQKVKSLEDDVKVLEHRIAEHEPKLTYLDTILQSQETVAISQIAADYGMSAIRLNRILCDAKVQRKVKTQWILTSKYLNHGFTKSETINIRRSDGTFKPIMNTNWTQKGRLFIHDLLTNLGYIANFDADMEAI